MPRKHYIDHMADLLRDGLSPPKPPPEPPHHYYPYRSYVKRFSLPPWLARLIALAVGLALAYMLLWL